MTGVTIPCPPASHYGRLDEGIALEGLTMCDFNINHHLMRSMQGLHISREQLEERRKRGDFTYSMFLSSSSSSFPLLN